MRSPSLHAACAPAQLADGLTLRGVLGDVEIERRVLATRLNPEDHYDICLVAVRRDQIDAILPSLAASSIPLIAFMHNHANGSQELRDIVGADRCVIAFPGAGGAIDADGTVRYALITEQATMVGQEPEFGTGSKVLRDILQDVGLRVTTTPDPDAWLRRHAVMVGALTGALWSYGCDAAALVRSRDGMRNFVLAVREGYRPLGRNCRRVSLPRLAGNFRLGAAAAFDRLLAALLKVARAASPWVRP